MSEIRPLAAVRYADRELSQRLAPPYDVLDEADKRRLLDRDPHNFVKIDLPFVPPKTAGPPQVYEQAAAQMKGWLSDGTLVRDASPALYAYHQRYEHAGRTYIRKKFFARLRLEPFGTGSVFPHEQTFGGPKEDRLMLTQATRANLSPIFGLYQDAENAVAARLEAALPREPLARGTLDGVENQLWAVSDAAVVAAVAEMMRQRPTFIADGHHRYGTALLYRDWLTQQQGKLPPDNPANFVLCVFCAMEDAGLLILPTHRVLPGVEVAPRLLRDDAQVEIAHLPCGGGEEAVAALAKFGPQAVALYSAQENGFFMVCPRNATILDAVAPEHSPAWRRLGLAFLHAYLLDRVVTPKVCGNRAPEIHYVKAAGPAVDEARQTRGSAFLMQPTTMAELRDVCLANDLMPQKSTYFYPKLASGLVINSLE